MTSTDEGEFTQGFARFLGVHKPNSSDPPDTVSLNAYRYLPNLCWLIVIILVIAVAAVVTTTLDSGLIFGWSSQGADRRNDRHPPITSLHTGNVAMCIPWFSANSTGSVSSTPAIWGDLVFYTTWNGRVTAIYKNNGWIKWSVRICEDVYDVDPSVCELYALNGTRIYLSVATPSVWESNIVISVLKPSDIAVLKMQDGSVVFTMNLDPNPRSQITQSGTVWDGSLYVGTSISDADAVTDKFEGCTFLANFFRISLSRMEIIWVVSMDDPAERLIEPPPPGSRFTGMRIMGSSPALSIEEGLISFSVGDYICAPDWYLQCIAQNEGEVCDSEMGFSFYNYETRYERCDEKSTAKLAAYDSVVVLRTGDGSLYWKEKLLGFRAWSAACLGFNSTDPCKHHRHVSRDNIDERGDKETSDTEICCDFYRNPYTNCPSEELSCTNDYEFSSDPVLKLDSNGNKRLFVMQNSGIVFSFHLIRKDEKFDGMDDDDRPRQVIWARSATQGTISGGIAVDQTSVYFSYDNNLERNWTYDEGENSTTLCGGWGAIHVSDGLPVWYRPNPACDGPYCFCWTGGPKTMTTNSGGKSPPTVTNDLLFVTSADSYRNSEDDPFVFDPNDRGGFVYALHTLTGRVVNKYETGDPFGKQGVAIYGRCAYTGNGPDPNMLINGSRFYAWCVDDATNRPDSSRCGFEDRISVPDRLFLDYFIQYDEEEYYASFTVDPPDPDAKPPKEIKNRKPLHEDIRHPRPWMNDLQRDLNCKPEKFFRKTDDKDDKECRRRPPH